MPEAALIMFLLNKYFSSTKNVLAHFFGTKLQKYTLQLTLSLSSFFITISLIWRHYKTNFMLPKYKTHTGLLVLHGCKFGSKYVFNYTAMDPLLLSETHAA